MDNAEPDVRNAFNLNVFMTKPKARALLWDWLAHSPAWNAEPTIAHQEIKRLNDNAAGRVHAEFRWFGSENRIGHG